MNNYKIASDGLKLLSVDMVERAGSGHPGAAMGMCDFLTVLYHDFLQFDVYHPDWLNRDRLILSNGHASTILYSALFLSGYQDITLEDLMNYRTLGSKTAGHPEFGHVKGIEMTTGPLGQGFASGVGMAFAERMVNRAHPIVNHKTYVIVGDGCLMEGVSYEAAAFAGRQNLSNLIVLYDDNQMTIEGNPDQVTREDRYKIFESMGWKILKANGHDYKEIYSVLEKAQQSEKPVLIGFRTIIGKGAPHKANTPGVHGAPLGEIEYESLKNSLKWKNPPFTVPEDCLAIWREIGNRNIRLYQEWTQSFNNLNEEEKNEIERLKSRDLPSGVDKNLNELKLKIKNKYSHLPTRKVSSLMLEEVLPVIPELISGSCDLGDSNGSRIKDSVTILPENNYEGNYIQFGIREHFMAAAINGFAIYGMNKMFGSTYLVFSDYMKPSIRLAAIMKIPSIYLFSHDSIGVGPDGPTHQPVEQLPSLRMIPGLRVFRPADAIESVECWQIILKEKNIPSAMLMSRQDIEITRDDINTGNKCELGGYFIRKENNAQIHLIASGSEVASCLTASKILEQAGIKSNVVTVPCLEMLLEQKESYQDEIFARGERVTRFVVEAAMDSGWASIIGEPITFIGMKDFGTSCSTKEIFKYYNLDGETIAHTVLSLTKDIKQ